MSSPKACTINSLFPQSKLLSGSSPAPYFDSSRHILTGIGVSVPSDIIKGQIEALVEAAEAAATSLACGSILAGQGSEGDDHGDVGLWLGKGAYGKGYESEVLDALGLQSWAQGEKVSNNVYLCDPQLCLLCSQIVAVELQPHSLPSTFPANLDLKSNNATIDDLTEILSSFRQKYCFRVKKAGPSSGGLVAFLLLGQLNDEGWGGLVGIGVWADD